MTEYPRERTLAGVLMTAGRVSVKKGGLEAAAPASRKTVPFQGREHLNR